jgi:isoleucyl-tRNA synthetase
MIDYRDDMVYGPQILGRAAESYRKIRNTARYLLSNLYDFDPSRDAVALDALSDIDKWALSRAAEVVDRCRRAYEEYEFHIIYHRVLDLCTVDLSSLYLDISKDTTYCEAPASRERRSAQTAMFHILRGLVGVLAPVLSFTAEEIYEAMPGKKEVSVHVTDLPQVPAIGVDVAAWDRLLVLREMVSKVLERARGAGQIGQSLEADVVLHGNFSPKALTGDLKVDLAKFFIVSHVDFRPPDEVVGDVVDIPGVGTIAVTMAPARGKKCGRCWQYREEVVEEGGLCARCESVIATLAPAEVPTA